MSKKRFFNYIVFVSLVYVSLLTYFDIFQVDRLVAALVVVVTVVVLEVIILANRKWRLHSSLQRKWIDIPFVNNALMYYEDMV